MQPFSAAAPPGSRLAPRARGAFVDRIGYDAVSVGPLSAGRAWSTDAEAIGVNSKTNPRDDLDDLAGLDAAIVRSLHDGIERHVRQLIDELGPTSTANQRLWRGDAQANAALR